MVDWYGAPLPCNACQNGGLDRAMLGSPLCDSHIKEQWDSPEEEGCEGGVGLSTSIAILLALYAVFPIGYVVFDYWGE